MRSLDITNPAEAETEKLLRTIRQQARNCADDAHCLAINCPYPVSSTSGRAWLDAFDLKRHSVGLDDQ